MTSDVAWPEFIAKWYELYGGKWLVVDDRELYGSTILSPGEHDPWDGRYPRDDNGHPVDEKVLFGLLKDMIDQPEGGYIVHSGPQGDYILHGGGRPSHPGEPYSIRTWSVEKLEY